MLEEEEEDDDDEEECWCRCAAAVSVGLWSDWFAPEKVDFMHAGTHTHTHRFRWLGACEPRGFSSHDDSIYTMSTSSSLPLFLLLLPPIQEGV